MPHGVPWGDSLGKGDGGRLGGNGLRLTDIPSTMEHVLGLIVDQIVTSVLERPEQRHGREEAMPFPRLSDVHVTQETLATIGCKLLPEYGGDTFMWSNDYPHSACIWPGATQCIAQDLGHLMPEARARVLCGNAARLYNDGQLPSPPDPAGEVKDLEAWNKVHWGE